MEATNNIILSLTIVEMNPRSIVVRWQSSPRQEVSPKLMNNEMKVCRRFAFYDLIRFSHLKVYIKKTKKKYITRYADIQGRS